MSAAIAPFMQNIMYAEVEGVRRVANELYQTISTDLLGQANLLNLRCIQL
jgi:hypothetical protein